MLLNKILLIQPPIEDFYETDIRLQPIGLCYLKSSIQKYYPEIKVKVLDFHTGWGRRSIPIPKPLKYLQSYYQYPDKSPFSVFYHYYHFGASFKEIIETIETEKADLIGISSLFTPYFQEVIQTATMIKQHFDIPIILGGSHVSAMPEQMLNYDCVDYIIRGEGEKPIVEFIKCWNKKGDLKTVPNLGYKKGGSILFNPIQENYPFNHIPNPDFSDFDFSDYLYEKKPLAFITTSRSCVYKCSFCSVHTTFGKKYRKRDTESIFQEMLQRYKAGYRVFDFEDDDLTYNKKNMIDLCQKLQSHFNPGDIKLLAMNGISYMSLDEELLIAMKRAGFSHLNLSLVSSNSATIEQCHRPYRLEKYYEVIEIAHRLGYQIVSYQIVGLPFENLKAMIETLILHANLPVLVGASMFYLPPGSPISEQFPLQSETELFKARLTSMAIETDQFCRSDIYTLFITVRIINFIKGLSFSSYQYLLSDLLDELENKNNKTKIGIRLLRRLFKEQKLFAFSGKQQHLRTQFNFLLFRKIWNQLKTITTQENKSIVLDIE
jgi:radical SAM superfamily enzyme YgiQ (UPF0313 family)